MKSTVLNGVLPALTPSALIISIRTPMLRISGLFSTTAISPILQILSALFSRFSLTRFTISALRAMFEFLLKSPNIPRTPMASGHYVFGKRFVFTVWKIKCVFTRRQLTSFTAKCRKFPKRRLPLLPSQSLCHRKIIRLLDHGELLRKLRDVRV